MSRFEEMQIFAKVVETGSITRAAQVLDIAKSAVSRRLAELESRLGVQLLVRTTRKLTLTETGRSYYERCLRLLEDLAELEEAVTSEHKSLSGKLKIAAPFTFGMMHLGCVFNDFMQMHPNLNFDINFNDRQVDIVQEGYDLAIRIGRLVDSTLIARPICKIHTVICASPAYLEKFGEPKTPEELTQHRVIHYSNLPNSIWRFWNSKGECIEVSVNPWLQANAGDYLRQAAVNGYGIMTQPNFILYKEIASGALKPILTEYQLVESNAYLIYPHTRHLSHRVRTFVDYVLERFKGTPYWDQPLNEFCENAGCPSPSDFKPRPEDGAPAMK
ncbi:LysR family transcriptional regulator [Hahella sp. HN01]|uniref:LysR family transcriptional regulator n=1 Tax=Hahella sp. HN01 TaxID=2847262 RepID=UPI001C1ED497|nr:LysR family transcriptional regulator [Hahella sp. HN01]MBU6952063.1 LysR family transcriptional regulator [Hahella sp. HN01]